MSKVIVTDMDDVTNHLLNAWLEYLNTTYNCNVKYEDVSEWNMQKAYPTLTPDQIYGVLKQEAFWENVDPDYEAIYYLRKLHTEGFKILVVTASSHNTIGVKVNKALLPYFEFLDYTDIIMTHHKPLIQCDYIVDDYLPNLIGSKAIKILKDAPYNQDADELDYDFRVTRWKEIYELIHQMENTLEQEGK